MHLDNDTKIKFSNAFYAMNTHSKECPQCEVFLRTGGDDLCEKGKGIVATYFGNTPWLPDQKIDKTRER